METTIKTDVIIVGAGPTGLSLACQLIRYGVDFVLVEKREGVTTFSKALGVHARTLEIYEQLGIAEAAIRQGTIAGKVQMIEGSEVRGEVDLSSVGKGLSAYPFMLVLEQSKNERMLYEYIQQDGREVLWQTTLDGFSQDENGVTAQITTSDGETRTVEAKYLAGCDGPRSPVRHQLGLSFEGSTFERIFYVADVRIDWNFSHDALQVCLVKDGVVAFFPMPGENRYRILGSFPEGFAKEAGEILYEEIERRIMEEVEVKLEITNVNWFSTYKVHTRHVERFSSGRCFLAGDAAHVHTPAGGQGMNTGIQDAYNLAWKLALVVQGKAAPRILETYNAERLENAENLLGTTDRMFNLLSGTDWLVNLIRTTVFPPMAKYILGIDAVKKRFFPLVSQTGINYRHHALSRHAGDDKFAVKAGDRLPYFLVNGASVYDRLHSPAFHLLSFSDGDNNCGALGKEIEEDYSGFVDHHVLPLYPNIQELFGTEQPFTVLLRPDNYIGFISTENPSDGLRRYLGELVGHTPKPQPVIKRTIAQNSVWAGI
jgi:2-polyprenyl-6-methoxyphenol hydroxylase-like FAD-dependent oxidoreductase